MNIPSQSHRVVKVFKREYVNKVWKREQIGVGILHQFGTSFEEFSDGAVQITVAVVELENGDVSLFNPENITFIDPLLTERVLSVISQKQATRQNHE